jgi:hypothetical protein
MKLYIDLYSRLLLVLVVSIFIIDYSTRKQILNNYLANQLLYVLLIVASASLVYNAFSLHYYLPFLGHTFFPAKIVPYNGLETLNNPKNIKLDKMPPNSKVIYWAASTLNTNIYDPIKAYGDYENSGSTITDKNGNAIAKIACPSQYYVGKGLKKNLLPKHIHYRYELPEYKGMYSKVYTKNLKQDCE